MNRDVVLWCNYWMCTCLPEADCLIDPILSYYFLRTCSFRILLRLIYAEVVASFLFVST